MPRRTIAVLLSSLLIAACGSAPVTAAPLAAPISPPPAPSAPAAGELHPALIELEAGVDDIFAQVPAKNWGEASTQVDRMTATWYARGIEVSSAGAPQAALNSLDAALADLAARSSARDAAGTLQAANLVSAAVADLYDVYLPPPSGDLRRLAMLERQLWLDADARDRQVTQGDFAQLKLVWERIAPQIRGDGGSSFADQFDASLAAQARFLQADDVAGMKQEIQRGWQLVTRLR